MSIRNKPYFADGSYLDVDGNNKLGYFNKSGVEEWAIDPSTGKITTFAGATAAGLGNPMIVSAPAISKSNTGAVSNLINYTPPAAVGEYILDCAVNVTAWTTPASFAIVVTYTDESGTADTETATVMRGSSGATAAAITAVSRWYMWPLFLSIDNSATAITLSTSGTFTGSPVYDISAVLMRVV